MKPSNLKVHEKDNVIVALIDLKKNMIICYNEEEFVLSSTSWPGRFYFLEERSEFVIQIINCVDAGLSKKFYYYC